MQEEAGRVGALASIECNWASLCTWHLDGPSLSIFSCQVPSIWSHQLCKGYLDLTSCVTPAALAQTNAARSAAWRKTATASFMPPGRVSLKDMHNRTVLFVLFIRSQGSVVACHRRWITFRTEVYAALPTGAATNITDPGSATHATDASYGGHKRDIPGLSEGTVTPQDRWLNKRYITSEMGLSHAYATGFGLRL